MRVCTTKNRNSVHLYFLRDQQKLIRRKIDNKDAHRNQITSG